MQKSAASKDQNELMWIEWKIPCQLQPECAWMFHVEQTQVPCWKIVKCLKKKRSKFFSWTIRLHFFHLWILIGNENALANLVHFLHKRKSWVIKKVDCKRQPQQLRPWSFHRSFSCHGLENIWIRLVWCMHCPCYKCQHLIWGWDCLEIACQFCPRVWLEPEKRGELHGQGGVQVTSIGKLWA